MRAKVKCIAIFKILYGRDAGKFQYKFWQEDDNIIVDEILLTLNNSNDYIAGDTYMMTLSLEGTAD